MVQPMKSEGKRMIFSLFSWWSGGGGGVGGVTIQPMKEENENK